MNVATRSCEILKRSRRALLTAAMNVEEMDKTRHDKIFIGDNDATEMELLLDNLEALLTTARTGDDVGVRNLLKQIVPRYAWEGDNVVKITPERRKAHTPTT